MGRPDAARLGGPDGDAEPLFHSQALWSTPSPTGQIWTADETKLYRVDAAPFLR